MAEMRLRLTPTEQRLALQWVTATIVGWVIGFVVCEAVKSFVATLFVDGLVIGASVGIAQWLVLRRRFSPAGWWVLVSIIGFGVGKAIGEIVVVGVPAVVGHGLSGALIGVSVGIAQWFVLRGHVARAGWWVPANILAWTVGWSIIGLVEEAGGLPTLMVYVVGAIGAAIAGTITGIALIWLSRPRLA
jgi:hypothetical protein